MCLQAKVECDVNCKFYLYFTLLPFFFFLFLEIPRSQPLFAGSVKTVPAASSSKTRPQKGIRIPPPKPEEVIFLVTKPIPSLEDGMEASERDSAAPPVIRIYASSGGPEN